MGTRELVIFYGQLSHDAYVWTFLDVEICHGIHKHALKKVEASFCYGHSPMTIDALTGVVELCAGAGFLSTGLQSAGFEILAGVEQNDHFRMLYGQQGLGDFLHYDIGNVEVVKRILNCDGQNSVIASGIACQPYSRAGDELGGLDHRATTLPKSLEVSWLIQSPIIILECTPRALNDPFVQSTLDHFCSTAGYSKTQGILKLEHSWASARSRWWCILSAKPLGEIGFPPLPQMIGFQRVDAIMPYIKNWPQDEIEELTLSWDEMRQFQKYTKGLLTLALDTTKQMPTALHSWGNQCCDCACGCRSAFSENRLQARGLFGVIIPSKEVVVREGISTPVCRHLHPSEVAVLCGAIPSLIWNGACRLGLAAVGQMASPIQSCWIGSHILKHLANLFHHDCPCPADKLRALINHILKVRDEVWPSLGASLVPTRSLPLHEHLVVIWCVIQNCEIKIACQHGTPIRQLLEAEIKLNGGELSDFQVYDDHDEVISHDCIMIKGMRIWVYGLDETPRMNEVVSYPPFTDDDMASLRIGEGLDFPMDSEGPSSVQLIKPENDEQMSGQNDVLHTKRICGIDDSFVRIQTKGSMHVVEDPLCKVKTAGFRCMLCPRVADVDAMKELRQQHMSMHSRIQVLENQELMWADDELLFQLNQIAGRAPKEQHVRVLDPLLMTSMSKYGIDSWISSLEISGTDVMTLITVIELDHHWIPVIWRKDACSLLAFVANASTSQVSIIQQLHFALCKAWQVPFTTVHSRVIEYDLPNAQGCGIVAIEFIEHLLWGKQMQMQRTVLMAKHALYRQSFVESLADEVPRPWIWGNGQSDPKATLLAILRQHGIADAEVGQRYDMLCQKLGKDKVDASASSPNPWRDLKWLANQSIPPIQIVMPSELQKAIDHRVKMETPLGRKKKQGKGKGKGKHSGKHEDKIVDPKQLRLEAGIFVANDAALKQIPLSAIGPASNGLVLATYQEACPYLQTAKPISSSGLGLVVVNLPKEDLALPVKHSFVTFPVICAANSEPMLIEGALFQLGVHEVSKAVQESIVELKSIDTCVAKCVLFRDQIVGPWDDVVAHPMKYLLQCLPLLVGCQKGCCDEDCGSWHAPPGMTLRDPLLEVWNRQWMTLAYAFTSPQDAEMYSVTLRLPKQLEEAIQRFSGTNGVFVEPKAIDGRSVSKDFNIIWVPKASLAQAIIYKQTISGILGLARIGAKLGLRCKQHDSAQVHAAVKPDIQYLPSGAKQTYLVGPVPWGTLKQSLNDALQEIGWEAKVLQATPAGKEFQGVMWRVHALMPPPKTILHLSSGEALITRVDNPIVAGGGSGNAVLGSSASVNIVKKGVDNSERGVDQIFVNDPWAAYQAPVVPPVHIPDALASLEQKVLTSVMSKLPKDSMEVDESLCSDRVGILEAKVQELHEQQTRMQSVIQDQGNNQQAQMMQMQTQFQAQHQRLEKVVGDQSTKLSALTNQFAQQLEKQQSHIDGMFQCQMQRIEDLLVKKARHE